MITCHASGACVLRRGLSNCTNGVQWLSKGQSLSLPTSCWHNVIRGSNNPVNGRRLFHKGVQIGSVTTNDASGTSLSDLVQAIKPSKQIDTTNCTLVILLTPSYARHVKNSDLPVSISRAICGSESTEDKFDSIAAVVDAIPSKQHDATEGLAYLIQGRSAVECLQHPEPIRKAAQRPGSLSFDLGLGSQQKWQLQLPLSQTVFSTGLTSTLISRKHSSKEAEEYLENLTIILGDNTITDLHIDFPLVQLTTYRTVQHSMGNIIRTLASHDGETSTEEPASRGLEAAVAAYFEALEMRPEPVDVWALIVPRSVVAGGKIKSTVEGLLINDDALSNNWQASRADGEIFQTLVEHQARLVKVLSGGGGWGKKAGLLSLDPDLQYSTRELRDDHGWQFDFDQGEDDTPSSVERQLDQALGSSVEEGDGIVFYIAPKNGTAKQSSADSLAFGTCNKTDSVEAVDGSTKEKLITYTEGVFGMFSETGMALQIRDQGKLVNKSKLEVPGLRVLLR